MVVAVANTDTMKATPLRLSIIIPVLNEEHYLTRLLDFLLNPDANHPIAEIVVVDGGSTDGTVQKALERGVSVLSSPKGRAKQMNLGAQMATGDLLYFIHADTLLPKNFGRYILNAVDTGSHVGCFKMKFESKSLFLRFFAWFTKFNHKICRGGDQTLFISKALFVQAGGYDENYRIYEDNEFIGRIYDLAQFKILPAYVITSARRYDQMGKVKLQFHFGMVHLQYFLGAGPGQLYDYYQRHIAG